MDFPDSLRSLYDNAKDYQLDLDDVAPRFFVEICKTTAFVQIFPPA